MRIKLLGFLWLVLAQTLAFNASAAGLPVVVSILPEKFFVERIGGSYVSVNVLVGPGRSPATYEPTPRQMAEMGQAKLFFPIGVPFERVWLSRIVDNNPSLTVVNLGQGIASRDLTPVAHHEGEADHHHDADERDPHTWTDPTLVEIMAERICRGLTDLDSAHGEFYAANLAAFKAELKSLDAEIRTELAPIKNRRFLVFHPAWGYFASRYNLEEVAVEIAGKEPGPQGLAKLINEAKQQQIRVIFVQQQFSTRLANMIAKEIGAEVATLDPLAENWTENLRLAARTFRNAMEQP